MLSILILFTSLLPLSANAIEAPMGQAIIELADKNYLLFGGRYSTGPSNALVYFNSSIAACISFFSFSHLLVHSIPNVAINPSFIPGPLNKLCCVANFETPKSPRIKDDSIMYCFGGVYSSIQIWRLNLKSLNWIEPLVYPDSLIDPRAGHQCAFHKSKFIVNGGMVYRNDGTIKKSTDFLIFDTVSLKWEETAVSPLNLEENLILFPIESNITGVFKPDPTANYGNGLFIDDPKIGANPICKLDDSSEKIVCYGDLLDGDLVNEKSLSNVIKYIDANVTLIGTPIWTTLFENQRKIELGDGVTSTREGAAFFFVGKMIIIYGGGRFGKENNSKVDVFDNEYSLQDPNVYEFDLTTDTWLSPTLASFLPLPSNLQPKDPNTNTSGGISFFSSGSGNLLYIVIPLVVVALLLIALLCYCLFRRRLLRKKASFSEMVVLESGATPAAINNEFPGPLLTRSSVIEPLNDSSPQTRGTMLRRPSTPTTPTIFYMDEGKRRNSETLASLSLSAIASPQPTTPFIVIASPQPISPPSYSSNSLGRRTLNNSSPPPSVSRPLSAQKREIIDNAVVTLPKTATLLKSKTSESKKTITSMNSNDSGNTNLSNGSLPFSSDFINVLKKEDETSDDEESFFETPVQLSKAQFISQLSLFSNANTPTTTTTTTNTTTTDQDSTSNPLPSWPPVKTRSHSEVAKGKTYVASYSFSPIGPGEIPLEVGDLVKIKHKFLDGWCFGEHISRGKGGEVGLFPRIVVKKIENKPSNFVIDHDLLLKRKDSGSSGGSGAGVVGDALAGYPERVDSLNF